MNFMAGYKESFDSLRLLNHPHIKPGLHYRATKATYQPLWLWSASLAVVMPLLALQLSAATQTILDLPQSKWVTSLF